ncbi:transposable element Tc1 transposase [Trichonephila clavipes]|nr:transposable element Tc1 transposase [Trichonephila clavipes]
MKRITDCFAAFLYVVLILLVAYTCGEVTDNIGEGSIDGAFLNHWKNELNVLDTQKSLLPKAVTPCSKDSDCHYAGKCSKRDGGQKVCECRKGTSGSLCQNVDECVADPYMCGNGTDVRCIFDIVREKAICKCDNTSKEFDKTTKTCRAVMRPILAYASPVWGYAAKTNINKLDTLQNSLIRMIKLLGAVDTRTYPRAENRVWSDQENHEERGSKDRAASTCGPNSDSFNDTSVSIVLQTISRHLAEVNLKSKHPFRTLPLTPEHQQLRLQWCQARSMWNVTDWQKVVFSDESRFVLETDDNRVRVWRHPGERYNSPHTVLRHTARTAGVMVWLAVAYDSRSTLIVMRGTLTGQRYVVDILRPHVGPFLNGLPGAIFQQDNARLHTARVAQDFLRHFQSLPWPTRSPDLSHVVHVWDQLKRQMPSCYSVHDLELAFHDLWAHMPQDNIRCLINSMPDRVAACIAVGGGSTRY